MSLFEKYTELLKSDLMVGLGFLPSVSESSEQIERGKTELEKEVLRRDARHQAQLMHAVKISRINPLLSFGLALDPLDRIRPGWADQARRYVLDGSNPELLLQLPHHPLAGNWLGSLFADWSTATKAIVEDVSGQSRLHRNCGYRHLGSDGISMELLERNARLLLAVSSQLQRLRWEPKLPDWVFMLLHDGFGEMVLKQTPDGSFIFRDDINLPATVEVLRTVVEHAGAGRADLLRLLFECTDEVSPEHVLQLRFLRGLADLLRTEISLLESLIRGFSAGARQLLAEALCFDGMAKPENDPWRARLLAGLAVDPRKNIRQLAQSGLQQIGDERRLAELKARCEPQYPSAERVLAIELLSLDLQADTRAWLADLRARETSQKVCKVLDRALACAEAVESTVNPELPEAPPYQPVVDGGLGEDVVDMLQQNLTELIAVTETEALQERAKGDPNRGYAAQQLGALRKIKHRDLQMLWHAMNGKDSPYLQSRSLELGLVLCHKKRVVSRTDIELPQIIRYMTMTCSWRFWTDPDLQAWLARRGPAALDFRQLAAVMMSLGHPRRAISVTLAASGPCDELSPECIWPWFAANPDLIEEGLGILQRDKTEPQLVVFGIYPRSNDLDSTLKVLGTFPRLPAAWIPRLLQIATGEGRSHRAAARALLSRLPDIGARVLATLTTIAQEARQSALRWLVELDYRAAVSTLRQMLVKETKELLRAELLATLEALGDDISAELSPAKLTAEAAASLKGKIPADVAWFDFERLPSLRWQDGSAVAPVVPRAWVVLAAKFKTPGGNPLLTRYLGLLDTGSAAELGSAVLVQFMAHDTRTVSITDAEAHADANVDQRYAMYQQWAKQYPGSNYGDWTREKVHAALKQEKLGVYLGSAIGAKGLLALIARVPGHQLVSAINAYMRDHHTRRAQIEALLEGLSQSSDPAAIQLLLAVSRRHRTASVQEKAKLLVADVAERLGWGPEQLADRTIPTAGLDERGEAELDYGTRQFQLKLDADLKLALFAADGKPLKALPDPRKDEDAAVVKEAKTQYTASKKELGQVLSLQQGRLYEAMCAGRRWPLADWRQYLAGHPIVGRLLQRLVWTADADGQSWQFRPSEDGALLDADDEELTLPEHAEIGLAHAALLPADADKRWLKHLKDYKIKPLFAQLDRPLPPALAVDAEQIDDRVGYSADTFGFRGAFTKLGYQRAQAEDGGCFYAYHKPYSSLGIRAVIEFTGSALPETNVAAALRELSFERLGRSGRRLKLSEVPPVLLAEAVADYHKVASIGAFDPQWEQRSPW